MAHLRGWRELRRIHPARPPRRVPPLVEALLNVLVCLAIVGLYVGLGVGLTFAFGRACWPIAQLGGGAIVASIALFVVTFLLAAVVRPEVVPAGERQRFEVLLAKKDALSAEEGVEYDQILDARAAREGLTRTEWLDAQARRAEASASAAKLLLGCLGVALAVAIVPVVLSTVTGCSI